MIYISHREFVDLYRKEELSISVDKNKAGDFVLSDFSKTRYQVAHNFWNWFGLILAVPGAIALLFLHWTYAIGSFLVDP